MLAPLTRAIPPLSAHVLLALVLPLAGCADSMPPPVTESVGQQIETYLDSVGASGQETTTSTGLVYVIREPGSAEKPAIEDDITIFYKGFLTNGQIFDETGTEPRTFPLSRLIAAWQEGIPLVGRGGEITLLAPPDLAYGDSPPSGSGISANSVLVFEIELVDF